MGQFDHPNIIRLEGVVTRSKYIYTSMLHVLKAYWMEFTLWKSSVPSYCWPSKLSTHTLKKNRKGKKTHLLLFCQNNVLSYTYSSYQDRIVSLHSHSIHIPSQTETHQREIWLIPDLQFPLTAGSKVADIAVKMCLLSGHGVKRLQINVLWSKCPKWAQIHKAVSETRFPLGLFIRLSLAHRRPPLKEMTAENGK